MIDRSALTDDELAEFRQAEQLVHDLGIRTFPVNETGKRAKKIWRQIRPHLLRGRRIRITVSSLGLKLHRQQLKRARQTLVRYRSDLAVTRFAEIVAR